MWSCWTPPRPSIIHALASESRKFLLACCLLTSFTSHGSSFLLFSLFLLLVFLFSSTVTFFLFLFFIFSFHQFLFCSPFPRLLIHTVRNFLFFSFSLLFLFLLFPPALLSYLPCHSFLSSFSTFLQRLFLISQSFLFSSFVLHFAASLPLLAAAKFMIPCGEVLQERLVRFFIVGLKATNNTLNGLRSIPKRKVKSITRLPKRITCNAWSGQVMLKRIVYFMKVCTENSRKHLLSLRDRKPATSLTRRTCGK